MGGKIDRDNAIILICTAATVILCSAFFLPKPFFTYTDQPSVPFVKSYDRNDDYSEERSYEEYGDLDCSDFSSQREAQDFFESEGGPDEDYHNLDSDGDGYVCESL